MIPTKLKSGDEIRVVAPSRSLSIIPDHVQRNAYRCLEGLGFKTTLGEHVNDVDAFASASLHSRLDDFHQAYADRQVGAILTAIGGFNSNSLLPYLDYPQWPPKSGQ